uniref:C2H2-type domain-containing protein n=1 Tax=Glossina pallidipes TaxID=7398 RepID=A0A1A9ZI42_GLOPL
MSNSDESTATNISLVSNKSEKPKRRKWNQKEYELIGDFLLNLYHRQVFTKNKHEFSVLRKEETLKEFLTFSKTAKVGEKFEKLSDVDNFGALLQNAGFLVESSEKSPFYKLKSSTLIRYRKNKLEKLDKLRINLDITDGQPSKCIDKENNAGTPAEIDESSQAYQLQYQGTTMQERNNDFYLTNTGCGICQENFETMSAFEEHLQKHSDDSDFEFLNSLTKFESPTFSMHYKYCKDSHKLCITFVSTTKDNLVIERIILVQTRSVIYALNQKVPYEMPAEGYDNFYVDSQLFTLHMEYPIVLVCHLKESKEIRIVEEHHLTISHELPSIKFGYNPNHIPKAKPFKPKIQLLPYLPPKKVENALSDDFFCEALMKNSKEFREYIKNDKILQLSTYVSSLTTLLQIEDVDTIKEYDKLTQQDVVVNSFGDDYSLKLKGKNVFIENILSPVDNVILKGAGKTYSGMITAVNVNRVSFCRDAEIIPLKAANETAKAKYTVSFRPSRFSIRHQYRALTLLSSNMRKFQRFLFPSEVDPLPAAHLSLDLYNKHIKHNPEQLQAVCNIVQGPRRDATYIIFGPPGTGKTTTVVEAILQLLKKPNTKILAVASSNAACDEVALRLCQALEPLNLRRTIARIYARSYEKRVDFIDDLLLDHSNMYDAHFFPCVEVLHMYRVVVCTLSIVAKLATGHFGEGITHIFIDEVAACTETEALLAIVNIANDASSLIISGDHKQLGPILQSTRSENLGLGVSLMDRLMERECYRCNADTGDYNRSIQTRLRLNFRSHPEIVNLFSGLYYNHTLEARSNIIMDYVKDFLYYGINGEPINEADIGIISPYKKQYQCIQEQLNLRKWFKIETGAVESFQGREKPIIIVSFVRSRTETLGFLKNPRRLNVTISRAKSLLILIGNAQTLSMNEDFAHIIDMCRRHGSFRGEEFKKNPNKSFLKSMEDLTLEEQQQFNIKRVTNNGRYGFVKKKGFGKYNAVAGKGGGEVIEQAKSNNSNINTRRQSRRSGYERRQRNVKSVNVSKDGAKSVEKQSKLNVTNIESLFNELPKVPQLVKSAENNASKGMNSVKASHPHTSLSNFLPIANPFIGTANNNVNFNNQGFYNADTFQMPPMGNGSSQMRAAGNGSSQMRLTGNQSSQSRPMVNGLSQMQSTGNGPPQMRPRSDISSQMRPMGNVPQQMWPKCNVPSQAGSIFNGFPQMQPAGNGLSQIQCTGNGTAQTRPMFSGSSQMPPMGNGSSQMRLTGNQPSQTRPMLNRPPQMQSTSNGHPQMRPKFIVPPQIQPMGNQPSQTQCMFNGCAQMQPVGNKPSQMQPKGNDPPQMRPMFNGPSQMPGNNPSSTVNNSNFHGSSIPSMTHKIKYDKTELLGIRKEMTTTTVARKADKYQTSNSLTDSQQHKNSRHTQSSLNTDSSTSTPNLLAKTSAKQSTKQSSSPMSDTIKNNKTATSSCGAIVAVTAVSSVRQTMMSTAPSSQQDKPNTSIDRKSSSNDPASPPVKSDILTNLSIQQQSNLANNTSCSASTASSNRPLDGNTTTSNSIARSGSAGSTSNYSGNPLISKPTTTNSAVLTAGTGSVQDVCNRQNSPVVRITTSQATSHRTTYAHTSAELTSNRALINASYSQRSPVACITTRSGASNHTTNYAYTSAELSSSRAAYSPQHVYYETVTRPESNLRSSNERRTTTKKDSGCQIS